MSVLMTDYATLGAVPITAEAVGARDKLERFRQDTTGGGKVIEVTLGAAAAIAATAGNALDQSQIVRMNDHVLKLAAEILETLGMAGLQAGPEADFVTGQGGGSS